MKIGDLVRSIPACAGDPNRVGIIVKLNQKSGALTFKERRLTGM